MSPLLSLSWWEKAYERQSFLSFGERWGWGQTGQRVSEAQLWAGLAGSLSSARERKVIWYQTTHAKKKEDVYPVCLPWYWGDALLPYARTSHGLCPPPSLDDRLIYRPLCQINMVPTNLVSASWCDGFKRVTEHRLWFLNNHSTTGWNENTERSVLVKAGYNSFYI